MNETVHTEPAGSPAPAGADLFRAFFEQAAVGIAQIETGTGRFLRVNQRHADLVGCLRVEMETLDFQTLTHPDDLAADWEALRRLVAGEIREFTREKRYRHQAGHFVWVSLTGSPLWAPGEPAHSFLAVVEDITARKVAEAAAGRQASEAVALSNARRLEAVQQSNRQLRMLSACNAALIHGADEAALLDTVCRIMVSAGGYRGAWIGLAENDAARTVRPVAWAGLDADYVRGLRVSWADVAQGQGPAAIAIRTGRPCPMQSVLEKAGFAPWQAEASQRGIAAICSLPLAADGRVFGVLSLDSAQPAAFDAAETAILQEVAGNLAFGMAALRMRQDRQRAEEALLISERKLAEVFRASPLLIGVTRMADGRFLEANEAFERMLGYPRAEVIGRTSIEIGLWVTPEDRAQVVAQVKAHGLVRQLETRHRKKSGEVIAVLLSMSPILLEGQACLITITADITERKRAEEERQRLQEQLTQAQKMESVGRLAGGVAHDFNNMLQVILGNADLALQELPPESPARECVEEIEKSARRSADLTRQLLAFARKQTIAPKVLDLNDIVSGMLKMIQRLIGEDINLSWNPGACLWPVKLDPSQIDQVLANLCVNARDAIGNVGVVTLETANVTLDEAYAQGHPECLPGDYVMLAVSDTGKGMDAETKAHLFEPFFTTKEIGKGTGLGLATVFGIVKQNQGLISVYSEPGQGTSFKIFLPRAEAEAPADVPAVREGDLRGAETVLLVEDEGQVLSLAQRILQQHGYTVLAARTPEAALKLAEQHAGRIQLLLTDVVMPGMNGHELQKRLMALQPGLRCLFMSGYTAAVIAHHGVLDEGVQFLQKPFSALSLAERVREVLKQPPET
jgi:PAS domain S-box-containing protein